MADLTADELLDIEDGFTEWNEDAAAGSTEETLEQALAEERLTELESELEQDEHPVDYDAELEQRIRIVEMLNKEDLIASLEERLERQKKEETPYEEKQSA